MIATLFPKRICLGLSICCLSMVGWWATAQEATGLGPLSQYLPQSGQDGAWRYTNNGDSFEIENVSDPNAIKYFYVGPQQGEEGNRVIELDLAIHPDSKGSAGLLYGLNAERTRYHMLTLGSDGTVALYRRDPDGFRLMLSSSSDRFEREKINTLRIEERGDTISYALNGSDLGEVGGDRFGFGAVGIGALGDVRSFFNHFDVQQLN